MIKKTDKKEKKIVYIGPTLPGVVKEGTIYIGKVTSKIEEACERIPQLQEFIVPVSEYDKCIKELKNPASALSSLYKNIEKNWR